MKIENEELEKLRRDKYSKPEKKLQWLYSALVFGKAKKVVVEKKSG
jgi:hypothetical protein